MRAKLTAMLLLSLCAGGPLARAQGQPFAPKPVQPAAGEQSAGVQGGAMPRPAPANVQIGPGDLIDVRVFDTPELSSRLRVQSDGTITLPVGGKLLVEGMTSVEAAQAIAKRLRDKDIMRDPHLDVFLLEYATQGVTVSGEVRSPGVYPLQGSHSVLDFISAAGGLTTSASHAVTIVPRDKTLKPYTLQLAGGATGNNLALEIHEARFDVNPGDTIIVGRSGIVYVVGDVVRAGGFLVENTRRLTVLQALALAQGTNKTAAENKAKLIRRTEEGREEIPVPLKKIIEDKSQDLAVQDGDILFVPSSGRKTWEYRGIEAAIQASVGVLTFRTY